MFNNNAKARHKIRSLLATAVVRTPAEPSVNEEKMQVETSVIPHINRSAIVETVVFLAAVVLLDFMFGDGTRFINTPLHPFWIIVLLITVQYGPIEALIAALLSGVILLTGNLPEQSLNETMYQYILRVSLTPVLWIITALILGSLRARQRAERRNLLDQLQKSEEAAAAIVENYKQIKQSKERLELRLAEERCSVLTVYEVAKLLETLDPAEALNGFEKLVRTALNPKKFSFFQWKNNSLSLDTSYGWEKNDRYEDRFHGNTSLATQVMREKRILSIIREDDEKALTGQGMLAGPIIDEETGKAFGMLKIEETGFTDLGIRTHETFRVICAWIARVCVNLEKYQESRRGRFSLGSKNGKKRRHALLSLADDEPSDNAA
jgi:hypothetical protein